VIGHAARLNFGKNTGHRWAIACLHVTQKYRSCWRRCLLCGPSRGYIARPSEEICQHVKYLSVIFDKRIA
jgi:hypothetical protein